MTKRRRSKSFSRHPQHSDARSMKRNAEAARPLGERSSLPYAVSMPETSQGVTFSRASSHSATTAPTLPSDSSPQLPPSPPIKNRRSLPVRILSHWLFWMTVSIAVTGGVAGFAGATLFKIPSLPNCPKIFWPTASAALRMQCAELAASKNTSRDLLYAIDLVDRLPSDHPMRWQVDQMIERWALDILKLADISFHNGDLDGAIASANRIPRDLKAYEQVNTRIEKWRSIWSRAESIYEESEDFMEQEDLRGAFAIAVKLLNVGNDHWETERYNQLTGLIETARIDTEKLNEARQLAKAGDVSSLLDAMRLVEEIQPKSRIYPPARRELSRLLDSLVDKGINALERGDSDTAMKVARNLPSGVEFQTKAQDLRELSFAMAQAKSGTVADIEAAIVQAQELNENRPLYRKAQQLISSWEAEIQDVRQLTRARELAAQGQIPDLQAAIAEAKLVDYNNPRGDEARKAVRQWTRQIQTLEDRPYLRNARLLAERGDIQSLDSAIQNVRRVSEGRPLYEEANRLASQWSVEMQTLQDQPYLNDAEQFAAQGNLPAAIAAAQQVAAGRALHDEAQGNIRTWQSQINGDVFLQEAYDAARRGTPTAWARAIRTADRIDTGHANRPEANRMMNRWSQNILIQAQQTASVDYGEAIAIARMVPQDTDSYTSAQEQISAWQRAIAQRDQQWSTPSSPIIPVNIPTTESVPTQIETPAVNEFPAVNEGPAVNEFPPADTTQ